MADRMASKTLRNLLLSVGLSLIPVMIIMALFTHLPAEKPKAVDWQGPLAAARDQSPYPVLAPSLPAGWTATKAAWVKAGMPKPDGEPADGNTWSMAWISPDRLYYGLDQRDQRGVELVDAASRHGHADGSSTVKGAGWTRYVSPDGRTRALTLIQNGVTTVVSGDVPYASLEQFAATLA